MNLVLISDTHNRHEHLTSKGMSNILPDGDLLIHAGDFTGIGRKGEVEDFLEWLLRIKSRYTHGIVFVAGNHDKTFDTKYGVHDFEDEFGEGPKVKPTWLRHAISDYKLASNNIFYLENSSVTIDGVKIWGSPITPWFHGDRWAFNRYRGSEIAEVWDTIPQDTDIIVTHGPVAYKLDYIPSTQEYVGCEDLRKAIKKIKPLLHVSGHIHESYGYEDDSDTHYFNASICDQYYDPNNKPWNITADFKNKTINVI